MAANIGTQRAKDTKLQESPELQLGLAYNMPVSYGELILGLDHKSLSYSEEFNEKFRFGTLYKYGSMNLGFSWDKFGYSAGVLYSLKKISSGILYTSTQLGGGGSDAFTQTVYIQLGWTL